MLKSLHVRNFAVIEDAELKLDPTLTVLTGETGAGKSILIGALQLLLGDRASTDQIRKGTEKAFIEGEFLIKENHPSLDKLEELGIALDDGRLIVRREIGREGRSRAFLNDTLVTVGALKETCETLVDLHGQHDHQSLLHPSQHLLLLDEFAGLTDDRESYSRKLTEYKETKARLDDLHQQEQELAQRQELYEFQLGELDELNPLDGEDEKLESELRILEGAEQLQTGFTEIIETLSEGEGALLDRLEGPRSLLADLSGIDRKVEDTRKLIDDARLTLQEVVHSAQGYLDAFDLDNERLEQTRNRFSDLIHLAKKYGGSLPAMITRREELRRKLEKGRDINSEAVELEAQVESLKKEMSRLATELSSERKKAVKNLQKSVDKELGHLAMSESSFTVRVETREDPEGLLVDERGRSCTTGPTGIDLVEFNLRTSPEADMMPLQKVASGGEISRVMLALKSVFGASSRVSTLVFDEIDSGIGGRTADRVADKLSLLAEKHQVLVITHLPQIARRGRRHLVVEKTIDGGVAQARIRCVEGEQRTEALAVLMSGDAEAESILDHARAMLNQKRERESTT